MSLQTRTTVIVPIRSFQEGKTRLGAVLPPAQRQVLARQWADGVLRAAGHLSVAVLTRDAEVIEWARSNGADTLPDRGWDLNSSLAGAATALDDPAGRLIIAHADLPMADDLTWLESIDGVAIIPDRRLDGTNVLAIPTAAGFRFRYGVSSSRHHQDEGTRLGLPVTVVADPLLGWDVDLPEDLSLPESSERDALCLASRRVRRDASARAPASPSQVG